MDVLAHSLWTNVMYKTIPTTRNNKRTTYWGILFGVLPDLVSFTPIVVYGFWQLILHGQKIAYDSPAWSNSAYYHWSVESYNYTHSFVIFAAATILLWIILRRFPWFTLGWALHIGIDIFSHTNKFFATPFLFPLSNFKVSVVSWGNPIFMAINYSLLIIFYIFFLPRLKSRG